MVLFKVSEDDKNTLRFLESNSTDPILNSAASNDQNLAQTTGKHGSKYFFEGSHSSINANKTMQLRLSMDHSKESYIDFVFIDSTTETEFFFVGTTKVKDWSSLFKFDGVLGLSYKNINGGQFDFLLNLIKHKKSRRGAIHRRIPNRNNVVSDKYSSCYLTATEDLGKECTDGFVCDLSHITLGSNKNLSETNEIQGRAIFDSAYGSVVAPIEFIPIFKEKYFSRLTNCSVFEIDEEDNDYTYTSCSQEAFENWN